jgi:hypothetical protein
MPNYNRPPAESRGPMPDRPNSRFDISASGGDSWRPYLNEGPSISDHRRSDADEDPYQQDPFKDRSRQDTAADNTVDPEVETEASAALQKDGPEGDEARAQLGAAAIGKDSTTTDVNMADKELHDGADTDQWESGSPDDVPASPKQIADLTAKVDALLDNSPDTPEVSTAYSVQKTFGDPSGAHIRIRIEAYAKPPDDDESASDHPDQVQTLLTDEPRVDLDRAEAKLHMSGGVVVMYEDGQGHSIDVMDGESTIRTEDGEAVDMDVAPGTQANMKQEIISKIVAGASPEDREAMKTRMAWVAQADSVAGAPRPEGGEDDMDDLQQVLDIAPVAGVEVSTLKETFHEIDTSVGTVAITVREATGDYVRRGLATREVAIDLPSGEAPTFRTYPDDTHTLVNSLEDGGNIGHESNGSAIPAREWTPIADFPDARRLGIYEPTVKMVRQMNDLIGVALREHGIAEPSSDTGESDV